jgi:predicted cupin superfamily sugar epimerase
MYRETYRSELTIVNSALPPDYEGDRSVSTAIYYLLTPSIYSGLHRLPTDEIFHFYLGQPVEMLQLFPDGRGELITLGVDLAAGMRPQIVVPGGTWQAARLTAGGRFALMGTTVAPGFDFRDFHAATAADVDQLKDRYPSLADVIRSLAPNAE